MAKLGTLDLTRLAVFAIPTLAIVTTMGCSESLVDLPGDASVDDSSIPLDGNVVDGRADAAADGRVADGASDATVSDASDASDARSEASPDSGDAGTDARDAAPEAASDAAGDAVADASDGAVDGGREPAPPRAEFITSIGNRLCQWRSRCCFGTASDPRFDMATCEAYESSETSGGSLGVGFYKSLSMSTNVQYDPVRAATCINAINDLSCGQIRGQELLTIIHTCYTAIVGTIPTGGPGCVDSIECTAPGFCENANGGSRCAEVRTTGAACPTTDHFNGAGFEQEICSYLGSGVSNNGWCNRAAPNGGACEQRIGDGEVCTSSLQCLSSRCVPTSVPNERRCDEFWPLLTPGSNQCTQFEIRDAGTD